MRNWCFWRLARAKMSVRCSAASWRSSLRGPVRSDGEERGSSGTHYAQDDIDSPPHSLSLRPHQPRGSGMSSSPAGACFPPLLLAP